MEIPAPCPTPPRVNCPPELQINSELRKEETTSWQTINKTLKLCVRFTSLTYVFFDNVIEDIHF